jgi:hypothetical protein
VIVVGMVSSYLEGRLVRGAVESLLEVELDYLYVFEGPAGEPLEDELAVPASELDWLENLVKASNLPGFAPKVRVHRGRWRADARKRDQMLGMARKDVALAHGAGVPWWAVVVDGDELLVNGRYLRDRLSWIEWENERRGASVALPDNPPNVRWPLRLIESDGSISHVTARVFRGDMVRSIDHSSSVITNRAGVREGWGNYGEASAVWIEGWLRAIDQGHMIAWPPFSGEPHLVHRSGLRHPLRRALRMSDQEAVEFARAQAEENGGT